MKLPTPNAVCVVGSCNMDLVVRAPRIPTPGETVLGGGYKTYPGGKGANQAIAAARMGAAVKFIGCIGDDTHAPRLREALASEKINLEGLETRSGAASGLALITVAESGENTIVVAAGANADLSVEQVARCSRAIAESDVLLLQLEVPNAPVQEAIRIAKSNGRAVILNAAPARSLPAETLRQVDVLVVNRSEAARLLAIDPNLDPARLALRLPELGPTTAVLTLGSQGSILAIKGRPRRVPTPNIKAVDAVGSGDAFCGALAACWGSVHSAAKARDPEEFTLAEEAMLVASSAGALASTKHGASTSMPTRDDVLKAAATLRTV